MSNRTKAKHNHDAVRRAENSVPSKPVPDAPHSPAAPLIIGHRGAAAVAPENAIISFKRALEDGADGIEFDVRLARDRVPVVIHDATLRRTGLVGGSIANLTSKELSRVDAGTWFNQRYPTLARPEYAEATVPTLAEAFEFFRENDARLYVELKCETEDAAALATETVALIRAHSLVDRVVVESFTHAALLEIKRSAEEIRTAALFEPELIRPRPSARKMIERAQVARADEIALHHRLVTKRITDEARRRGMNVVVWTVDNPAWIRRAIEYEIYALITNDPARMNAR